MLELNSPISIFKEITFLFFFKGFSVDKELEHSLFQKVTNWLRENSRYGPSAESVHWTFFSSFLPLLLYNNNKAPSHFHYRNRNAVIQGFLSTWATTEPASTYAAPSLSCYALFLMSVFGIPPIVLVGCQPELSEKQNLDSPLFSLPHLQALQTKTVSEQLPHENLILLMPSVVGKRTCQWNYASTVQHIREQASCRINKSVCYRDTSSSFRGQYQ